jgi:hypothetical protein
VKTKQMKPFADVVCFCGDVADAVAVADDGVGANNLSDQQEHLAETTRSPYGAAAAAAVTSMQHKKYSLLRQQQEEACSCCPFSLYGPSPHNCASYSISSSRSMINHYDQKADAQNKQ